MSESKKEWKVVDGYYPGFLNIVGASYTVSIVTSATDLTLEDYVNRTNDAHLMAAAPKLGTDRNKDGATITSRI